MRVNGRKQSVAFDRWESAELLDQVFLTSQQLESLATVSAQPAVILQLGRLGVIAPDMFGGHSAPCRRWKVEVSPVGELLLIEL
jgi:hypothetical protein